MPYFSFPLVLQMYENEEDQDDETLFVAVTGGLSALIHSVVMLRNLADVGLSVPETVSSPLLHIEQGGPASLSGCMSVATNNTVVFRMLSEQDGWVKELGECSGGFLSMHLQLKAKHVGAYGATKVNADGY